MFFCKLRLIYYCQPTAHLIKIEKMRTNIGNKGI